MDRHVVVIDGVNWNQKFERKTVTRVLPGETIMCVKHMVMKK